MACITYKVDQEQLALNKIDLTYIQNLNLYIRQTQSNELSQQMQDLILTQLQMLESSASHILNSDSNSKSTQNAGGPKQANMLSYQQQNQQQIMQVYGKYFRNIRQAYLHQESIPGEQSYTKSKIYEKLVYQYSLLGNSLWAHVDGVFNYIQQLTNCHKQIRTHKQNMFLMLSHFHYHTQSPLLAVYLNIMHKGIENKKAKVKITGSKKNIQKGWASSIVKFNQVDKTSAFKTFMQKQGIQVNYYQDQLPNQQNKEVVASQTQQQESKGKQQIQIQIIDLFNTHVTLFRPYLLSQIQKNRNKNNKIFIFYLHPAQSQQISDFINNTYIRNKIANIESTETSPSTMLHNLDINSTFPYETALIQANSINNKFQQQLLIFLNEQINHPSKQDVIIFHEPTQEFIKKIKNYIKKHNAQLMKNIRFVTKSSTDLKESLPPPPAFLSKVFSMSLNKSQSFSDKQSQIKSPQKQQKVMESSQIKVTSSNISTKSITSQPSQKLQQSSVHTHNNIIIIPNYKSLIQLNIDISHVFYIFDFRNDQTFHYSYQTMSYIESCQEFISQNQALLRVSCMGINKIGKYCYVKDIEMLKKVSDECKHQQKIKQKSDISNCLLDMLIDNKTKDIGYYCLAMIDIGHDHFWQEIQQFKQIKSCITALQQAQIIKKQAIQNSKYPHYTILNRQLYKNLCKKRDLNPVLASVILKAKNGDQQHQIAPAKLALQLAIATSIMMTPGNLRLTSTGNNTVLNRPTPIWRSSGYLHSCIDIIVRAKIIQMRQHMSGPNKSKKSVSKRLSKVNSAEFDIFGNLFEIVMADRITFDQMSLQDLIRQQFVNEQVFNKIVDTTQKICQVLDLQDFMFNSFEDINPLLIDIINKTPKAIGVYSGSRRIGYFIKGQTNGIFPSKSSLLTTLNERPSFIYISRLISTQQIVGNVKYQVLMCNSIPEVTLFQSIGLSSIPSRKTNSYGQSLIQYHAVTSLTFKSLWRNNGTDIYNFQDKFGCLVQPNQQIALIAIHCPKQKQKQIKQQFENLLNKVKEKMAAQTKMSPYLGTTSLLLGVGGSVIQVIKDKYINKCMVTNLDLSVQVDDLQELFEEFFILKDIKVVRQPPSASFKTAYIQFQTQKDYYRFSEYYNQCLYLNRYIRVCPVESIPAISTYKQEMYLQFVWNAWKSSLQAIVQFQEEQAAQKCLQSLKTVKLDDKMVTAQIRKNSAVYLSGLNPLTDQINLDLVCANFGKIKSIQILKTPSKQNLKSSQAYLEQQIRRAIVQNNNNVIINVEKVQKLKNGLRKCKVVYKDQAKLNQTITKLNKKTGVMGLGRIHITSWFLYPIKVTHGYISLYQLLVSETLKKIPDNRLITQNTIYNQQEYIVIKSHLKQQLDIFKQKINQQLQGYNVQLTGLQSNILLTQVGIQNLLDLEQKHNCRLIPDFGKKTLVVLALFDSLKAIKQQIKAKVQDNFFYRISLNHKSYKHMKQNPELLQKMKAQYFLAKLELEQVGRNLLLQGSANHVQKAFNYLMHLIQSISKPSEQQMFNSDVCGVCCEQPFRPYRLQRCGHKFCLNCILDFVNTALTDISMFPIKCPQCLLEVAVMDLNQLLTPEMWIKSNNVAINQYVGRNSQILSNCYTAGCKQVNFLIKNYFNCDQCQHSYCIGCKLNYHPGLTCQQAKQGGNAAFQKYMKQNGIRKCPNQACKMPIMRTDGCYRVTCSRCNKSMCFKCQPEKMIAYDHYNDCYKHLTDAHGGYW